MTIRRISSGPGLPGGFPFSLASEDSGTLYISGMPALDPDGNFRGRGRSCLGQRHRYRRRGR